MPRKYDTPTDRSTNWPNQLLGFALVAMLLSAVAFVVWLLQLPESPAPNPETQPGVGHTFLRLDLQPLTGDPRAFSLQNANEDVVLLNFWGTWCGPCREELPHIAAIHERFAGNKRFRLLAVSYPPAGQQGDFDLISLRETTAALLRKMKIDMPTYCDPDERMLGAMARTTGSIGFPTTFLLDRSGTIRAAWIGYRPGAELEMERLIGVLLKEKPPEK